MTDRADCAALEAAEARMRAALHKLSAPMPSTKGMDPKARAQRLHAEIERRIAVAKDALWPWRLTDAD